MRKEINEIQVREEMMWNQRSRNLWLKWGDKHKAFPGYSKPKTEEKLDCEAARFEWGLAGR